MHHRQGIAVFDTSRTGLDGGRVMRQQHETAAGRRIIHQVIRPNRHYFPACDHRGSLELNVRIPAGKLEFYAPGHTFGNAFSIFNP